MAPRQLAKGKHHNSLGPLTKPDIAMCPVYNIRDITMRPHLLVPNDATPAWLKEFNVYINTTDEIPEGQTIIQWWGVSYSVTCPIPIASATYLY